MDACATFGTQHVLFSKKQINNIYTFFGSYFILSFNFSNTLSWNFFKKMYRSVTHSCLTFKYILHFLQNSSSREEQPPHAFIFLWFKLTLLLFSYFKPYILIFLYTLLIWFYTLKAYRAYLKSLIIRFSSGYLAKKYCCN